MIMDTNDKKKDSDVKQPGADSALSSSPGSESRLRFLKAMLEMMDAGDGIIGQTEKSRLRKESLRGEIESLQNSKD